MHFTARIQAFLVLSLCLLSCDNQEKQNNGPKVYFDLKGFIENQIIYLSDKKPPLLKVAMLDGKKENHTIKEPDWKKELELFMQADINKPAYNKSYQVDTSNSNFLHYSLKPNEKLTVRDLQIKLDSLTKVPVFIKAIMHSENKIYESEKIIQLHCTKKDNLWEVADYSISGYQKLILMDKREFDIHAKIGL